jgi:hypothetical protein
MFLSCKAFPKTHNILLKLTQQRHRAHASAECDVGDLVDERSRNADEIFQFLSRFVQSFPFFLFKQCTAELCIECDVRFRIARFSPKGEVREILPLAVRAAILRIRPNFLSRGQSVTKKELHHGIWLPFSLRHRY